MSHRRRMTNQCLDTAQAFGKRTKSDGLEYSPRRLERSHLKRNHAAETALLSLCQYILGMRCRAWIINLVYPRMLFQERRHRAPGLIMLLHTQRQGLGATHDEP